MEPQLPDLPRPARQSRPHTSSAGPKLPGLKHGPAANHRIEPRQYGWGGPIWFEVDPRLNPTDAVGGICNMCGSLTRAIDLKLRRDREGNEFWVCTECSRRDGLSVNQTVKRNTRKPAEELHRPQGGINAMRAMMNELLELGHRWLGWHPPMTLGGYAEAAEIAAAFRTAAHISNVIARG